MSGCYWVSRECVWQRLMLNRALTLKIKARLPRRDFDIMINQFKMTSLPLLILLPPARIIQPRDLHPANQGWLALLYLGSQPALGNRTFVLCSSYLLLGLWQDTPSAGICLMASWWWHWWAIVLGCLLPRSDLLFAGLSWLSCLLQNDADVTWCPALPCPARVIFQVNGYSKHSTSQHPK